jgi:hypothetical protein
MFCQAGFDQWLTTLKTHLPHLSKALVGFRGRGCAEGIQHDFLSPSLP